MFKNLFTSHRRQTPRHAGLSDRRSGAPVRRRPEPMPRIRYYS